jgi:hypothetical protein
MLWMRASESSGIGSRAHAKWRALAAAALFPLVIGGIQLGLNAARFDSPFEFGYRFQLTPPDLRMRIDTHGSLSHVYLAENIRYNFLQPPVVATDPETGGLRFPFLKSDPHGMGVFFVTPAFLMILMSWRRQWGAPRLVLASWMSLAAVTLPALLFFNTGWVQWGGRYLLDAWPLWLILTALGLQCVNNKVATVLIGLSVVSNLWAAVVLTGGWWP